jgi:hypothetical protein
MIDLASYPLDPPFEQYMGQVGYACSPGDLDPLEDDEPDNPFEFDDLFPDDDESTASTVDLTVFSSSDGSAQVSPLAAISLADLDPDASSSSLLDAPSLAIDALFGFDLQLQATKLHRDDFYANLQQREPRISG